MLATGSVKNSGQRKINGGNTMKRRTILGAGAAALALSLSAKLYIQQKGDAVAGKKIQLIIKDDTGVADVTKRLAQELIVQEKVSVLAGFGLTPLALATAPLATQGKVPEVVMAAATSIIPEQSPYIV